MRSEKYRQLDNDDKKKAKEERKAKWNKFTRTMSLIYLALVIVFVWLISWLDVLPGKYYYPMIILLGLVVLLTVPAMFSKKGKMGRKIVSTLLAFVLIFTFAMGSFYMAKTAWLLKNITDVVEETDDYHIIGPKAFFYVEPEELSKQDKLLKRLFDKSEEEEEVIEEALYQDPDSFKNISLYYDVIDFNPSKIASYYTTDRAYGNAKAKLVSEIDCTYIYEENIASLVSSFMNGKYAYIYIPHAAYESLKAENEEFEEYAMILYTVSLPMESLDVTSNVDVTKESFNIYISGSDVQGNFSSGLRVRSDVNMVVTVNPVTHQILMTTIPRDYFVTLHSKGETDKLTHASLYGIEESIATIEDTLGIDINYYLRVNFTTMIKLVDAIGGIDVVSDYDFTTSGMGKDMRYLNGLHFVKGTNHLNGNQALAFCRERHSFVNGDLQRGKNQQKVLEAILKKCTQSSTILNSYTKILDALNGKMVTNMTTDEMSSLIKMQVNGMPSWDIEKKTINSKAVFGYCYSLGFEASVVANDPVQNQEISDAIYMTMLIPEVKADETTTK